MSKHLPAHDVTDLALADEGVRRIEWAEREMPVLRLIRERFEREKPLAGIRIGACLHVTTETANLMRTLAAGGAEVSLAASNPLSTKDDVAAALTSAYGISTYARRGEDRDTYYRHLNQVADTHPQITMDDGCDLVSLLHSERPKQVAEVLASGAPASPVLVAAARHGLVPSLWVSALSVLSFNFFFLPPLYQLTISDPANVVALFFFMFVAVAASALGTAIIDHFRQRGAYVVATLRRPLDAGAQRMPGRAIGLKWFAIDKAARTLQVALTPPALVRPAGGRAAAVRRRRAATGW